jgi:hypothetical protein
MTRGASPALLIGQILDRRHVLLRNVLILYVYLCDRAIEMRLDIALDGVLQFGDGFEDAAADFSSRDGREESFDGIEPRRRCRREMKCPTRMIGQPRHNVGMFVRGVIVGNGMDDFAGGDGAFHGVEELDEFLVSMLWHAASDHGPVENIEGGKQCRRAVTLVIMGHGPTLAGFERQARLGAIESLDLALLVDRQDDGMSGRVHVETDHVFDLFGEFWIIGALERPQAMWLEAMGIPQTLDGAKRDADGLGHRPGRSNGWLRPAVRSR